MKHDKRSIVRKRTQQLVYVELGRDNGGVMLNLSEDGCGFQAISPVKPGETRFAFQISGGRRIAGEAETVWVDDIGVMGGLRFVNLDTQPRQEIRKWLAETNAPEDPGETLVPAAAAPLDAVAKGSRLRPSVSREENSASIPQPEHRQNSWAQAGAGVSSEQVVPSSGWGDILSGTAVVDDRPRLPLLREDGGFGAPSTKSLAFWRGIAAITTAAAVGALLVVYQRDVGRSLIWLGETLSGKTKASVVLPENKPEQTATPPTEVKPPAEADSGTVPKKEPDAAPSGEQSKETAAAGSVGAPESVLERQGAPQKTEPWNGGGETLESLWAGVQSGSVSAEVSLAERFARGDGVAQNCDQAKVLLRAASRRGSREATLRLYQLESEGCHTVPR